MYKSPSLKDIVNKYGLAPKKSLGQNFIFDQNITDKIVRFANITNADEVLEIGPGPGGLTRSILSANPKKLTVIEQDHRSIAVMEDLKNHYPLLNIIHGDALKIKEEEIVSKKSKIIANLPYNIGTMLLLKWLKDISFWQSLTLMFQKEVVDRIIANPFTKDYGRLSVICQLLCDCKVHFNLNPEIFYPPPKIISSVVSLYPKPNQPTKEIIQAVELITRTTFNQRRKMLKSTLKQVYPDLDRLIDKTDIKLTQRPEELLIEQFVSLAENYVKIKTP